MTFDSDPRFGPGRRWPAAILAACLALTAAGAATTLLLYRDSERQLLDQQSREAAAVLTSAIGEIETSLHNLATVSAATDGDPALFDAVAAEMLAETGFVSIALVDDDGSVVRAAGVPPLLTTELPEQVDAVVAAGGRQPGELHVELLTGSERRIGYVTTAVDGGERSTVYAETPLPRERTGIDRSDGPFSDIDYAIYLGEVVEPDRLLYTSADRPEITGTSSTVTLEFADEGLVFVAAATRPLAGGFAQAAPWALLIGGLLVSGLAGIASAAIIRRRRRAEQLAAEITRLYEQQQVGIDTLRRSLLPRRLASPPECAIETGYWPADADHEVSGDFYDAFRIDERRWALVIGDVCGKGSEAAALTALTRHTIRAAARHLQAPTDVLRWTHEAIDAHGAATYVTACFAFVEPADDGTTKVALALGGHPRPALWRDGAVQMIGTAGTILGLIDPHLETTRLVLGPGDVLVLYTDGLTDSADRPLTPDELATVIEEAVGATEPGETAEAIHGAVQSRRNDGTHDDSAVLIVRFGPVGAELPDEQLEAVLASHPR